MPTTIYATFANEGDAERAAGALMDHGVASEHISFILPERLQAAMPVTESRLPAPGIAPRPDPVLEPAAENMATPEDIPIPDVAVPPPPHLTPAPVPAGSMGPSNPAQPGVQPGYRYDALGAVIPDTPDVRNQQGVPVTHVPSDRAVLAADTPIDTVNANHAHIIDMNRRQPHAAGGISTTTGRDAAKGAAEGAGIGVGLGILLGLATVAIPGIGLVAGAGALVAGLAAATGVAGGIAGGVYGYLADLGLPPATVRHLTENLQAGGPVLSVEVAGETPSAEILQLLRKYNATSAEAFG